MQEFLLMDGYNVRVTFCGCGSTMLLDATRVRGLKKSIMPDGHIKLEYKVGDREPISEFEIRSPFSCAWPDDLVRAEVHDVEASQFEAWLQARIMEFYTGFPEMTAAKVAEFTRIDIANIIQTIRDHDQQQALEELWVHDTYLQDDAVRLVQEITGGRQLRIVAD